MADDGGSTADGGDETMPKINLYGYGGSNVDLR